MEGEPPPVEERRRLQEELSEFVESCCRTLEEVTASLGWNLDSLDPGEEEAAEVRGAAAGPFGDGGRRACVAVAEHARCARREGRGAPVLKQSCSWRPGPERRRGPWRSLDVSESGAGARGGLRELHRRRIIKQARTTVGKDGDYNNQRIYSSLPVEVPLNHKRFVCDLTQADRLALYDFVVEETKKQRSDSQIIENDSDLFVDLAAKVNQAVCVLALWIMSLRTCLHHNPYAWSEERRSASVDSRQSVGSYLDAECSRHRRDRSRSPHKRKRNKDKDKNCESRRRKERDGDRHHSHKRRKQKI
ncbi:PREDICTED: U11/U12 small nuclear ribonucleoprotein 48 kDa protein [Propithecus coquereli]|uniref:U11/U12 small nuclear ribonucleoprotein 48 kDa protein n=1 Tax=Propithecus coquereli TaxID=379532 RepID=UPI00063FBB1E|nr:PREDICTED: U11/U12 small nuclear ribonucleoprotein 48 kDa protein [Propithecus coquereli]